MGQTRVRKSKRSDIEPNVQNGPGLKSHKSRTVLETNVTIIQNRHLVPDSDEYTTTSLSLSTSPNPREISQPPEDDYIEIKDTETKGQAVFAKRKIQPGALILSETSLIRLTQAEEDADKDTPFSPDNRSALETSFASLLKATQKAYLKLFDSKKADFHPVKSIYYSNCYNLSGANKPSKSSPGGSCIGLTASRINHSCIPNVQFSYDESNNMMLFHALKAIPKGREILSNYNTMYELRAQRQRRQMLYYGFKCDCEACDPQTDFWMKSDERRRVMLEAKKAIKECEDMFEEKKGVIDIAYDPVHALDKLESLLIKEGIMGLPLADLYRSMVKWADRKGDRKQVEQYRRKELEACVVCFGERSGRVDSIRQKMNQGL